MALYLATFLKAKANIARNSNAGIAGKGESGSGVQPKSDLHTSASYRYHDEHKDYKHHPMPYYFSYGVKDDYYYNLFGHEEKGDGKGGVKGSYHVKLPDGKTQIVKYHADHYKGYNADVYYEGVYGKGGHYKSHHDNHYNHKHHDYHQYDNKYKHSHYDHGHHGYKHDHKHDYGHKHSHGYGHHDYSDYHGRENRGREMNSINPHDSLAKHRETHQKPGFIPLYQSSSTPLLNGARSRSYGQHWPFDYQSQENKGRELDSVGQRGNLVNHGSKDPTFTPVYIQSSEPVSTGPRSNNQSTKMNALKKDAMKNYPQAQGYEVVQGFLYS
ncbi:histidine-rich glycoprotein-like isoform X2 [Artemia franciscana]|uniref:Cuticle protein n=2 Tax=Artemia franciscana TaxID=6661 RepID=A0AA88HUF4_ARTSF|nr:hypothetical protein QYM36_011073 [Artemia franciscana]KAK2712261.1 hypothetical protein QYM36_011073 [Artemia franciscana]